MGNIEQLELRIKQTTCRINWCNVPWISIHCIAKSAELKILKSRVPFQIKVENMATSLSNPESITSGCADASPSYLEQEYEKKCSVKLNELNTVTKSLYEKGLGRKISYEAMLSPEMANNNINEPKDLAAVHLERAMTSGVANNEGRRWRRKLNVSILRSPKLRTVQLKEESAKYGF